MYAILKKFAVEAGMDWDRLLLAKPELLKGIY